MARASTRALDTRFYRAHHGLSPIWRRGLARMHYALRGRKQGLQPHPLFDPHFFVDEAARRGHGGITVQDAFDAYLTRPELWSVDPHAYASFAHEPFASQQPTQNPILAAERIPARMAASGSGHPLLNATWWITERGDALLGPNPSLSAVLQAVAVEVHAARGGAGDVALGPDLDVLFINGEDTCPACTQYRVWNPALALRRAGLEVAIVNARDLWRLEGARITTRAVVVFRAISNPHLMQLLQRCKQNGTRIIFDCDDLIFGPEQVYGMMAGRHGVRDREGPNSHIRLVNEVFQYADLGTFPTEALASAAIDFGLDPERVYVTPSFLSAAQVAAASTPGSDAEHVPEEPARLAMASGTWTHHDDFATIAPIVSEALAQGDAELHALGSLPPEDFPALSLPPGRLMHDPRVIRDWADYVNRYRGFSACLVPLDLDNGFCHAKSEVKYLEAGLAATPIIASPTEANVRAISGNATGWLAHDATDWRTAIARVASDPRAAAATGLRARDDVLSRYGPDGTIEQSYVRLITELLAGGAPSSPVPRNRLSIADAAGIEISGRLRGLMDLTGCRGIIVRRHPRAPDAWIDVAGTTEDIGSWARPPARIVTVEVEDDLRALDAFRDTQADTPTLIVQGPDLAEAIPDWWPGEVRVGLPFADPATFSERSTLPHAARRPVIALLAPPARAIGAAEARAARGWARHADATGSTLIVIGVPASEVGLPLLSAWTPGCSELELATILRECAFAVRLHPFHWGEPMTAALLTGTPIASLQEPTWGDAVEAAHEVEPLHDWPTWAPAAAR